MKFFQKKYNGFTLVEMMLVLVIASSILMMALNLSQVKIQQMRRERTAIQMQGILNAAASYYIAAGKWPSTFTDMINGGYLPNNTFNSGWGDTISGAASGQGYQVSVTLGKQTVAQNTANALVVSGMLPLGTVSGTNNTTVSGFINVPGENLNNALAVNFGAVYYSGACVPAPACPTGMNPSLMVIPVSATGVLMNNMTCSDKTNPATCSVPTSAITSFTAYYRGTSVSNDTPVSGNPSTSTPPAPADCEIEPASAPSTNTVPCDFGGNSYTASQKYWRVCLAVATTNGLAYPGASDSYAYNEGKLLGSILAITRCMPSTGDIPQGSAGSGSNAVWTPNKNYQP